MRGVQFCCNTENIALGKNLWRGKPKFHMFQEMAQFQNLELGNPMGFCLEYKDEDFVGWVNKLAKRWGGPCAYTAQATNVLLRYNALAGGPTGNVANKKALCVHVC